MAANLEDAVKRLSTADFGNILSSPSNSRIPGTNLLGAETRTRIEAATALRDGLDYYTNGQNYALFLRRVMPVFIHILRGPCIFQSNSPEQVGILSSSF